MKIAITGANGRIGRLLQAALEAEHDVRPVTRSAAEPPARQADLTDLEALRHAFEGTQAVIHLAAASAVRSSWEEVLPANLVGVRNVYEAARLEGVEQVVYASSTHTVAGHERAAAPAIYDLDAGTIFGIAAEPRPDSLYGASKVFGEALGRWYSDVHGLRVICLRIGYVSGLSDAEFESPRAGEEDLDPQQLQVRKRMRAIWLSRRDCVELFRRALASERRWAVVYATSNNPRQIWDLRPARELLGFEPRDGAPR
jgi:NAD+ dependent glucose-6-phosphate dehydrogenase